MLKFLRKMHFQSQNWSAVQYPFKQTPQNTLYSSLYRVKSIKIVNLWVKFCFDELLNTFVSEVDLRKRALLAADRGGPSVVQNFHFGRPKSNFSGFLNWKKKGKVCRLPHRCYTTGALKFELHVLACLTFTCFWWGPDLFGWALQVIF